MNDLWIDPIPVGRNRYGVQMVAIPVICRECGCQYQHDFPADVIGVLDVDTLYQDAYMTPVCPICWRAQGRAAFRFHQPVSVDVGDSTFVLPAESVNPLDEQPDVEKVALLDKIRQLEEELAIQRQALADAQVDVLVLKEERDALRESLTEARAEIGKRVMVAQKVDALFTTETRYFNGKIGTPDAAAVTAKELTALIHAGWKVVHEQFVMDEAAMHYARLEREVEGPSAPLYEHAAAEVEIPVPSKRRVSGELVPVQPPDTAPQNFAAWQAEQDARIMARGREAYERFRTQFPYRPFTLVPGAAK